MLIALVSVLCCAVSMPARAQDQAPSAPPPDTAPPSQAPAPAQSDAEATLVDGSELPATTVPPSAPLPGAAATPGAPSSPSAGVQQTDYFRAQQLNELMTQRERLLASNRRWLGPTLGLSLGVLSLVIGAVVWAKGLEYMGPACDDECPEVEKKGDRLLISGLSLMVIGTALTIVATPMLIVRRSREARLRGVERTIKNLGGQLTLAPMLAPRAEAGLCARFVF
jgi:hypothetical protein